jgi:CCR4-NOT transcription complex subunit 4
MNTATAQRHYQNGASPALSQTRPLPQPVQSSQPMRRQGSKDEAGAKPATDGSALPSSASWANKDGPLNRARPASLSGSRSSPSPKPANVTVAARTEEIKRPDKQPIPAQDSSRRSTPAPAPAQSQQVAARPPSRPQPTSPRPEDLLLESLLKAVNSPDFRFCFSTDGLSAEDLKFIENGPSFIDPYGGVKRRAMREKAEQERAKQDVETQSLLQTVVATEEETRESGSLQLGGEPDDVHHSRGAAGRGRETVGTIQPPSQQGTASNSVVSSPVSLNHPFQGLAVNGRSLTPLQQQQLMLLKSANAQQSGLMEPLPAGLGATSFEQAAQARHGLFQGSVPQVGGVQGHARQSSRFSFANDSNAKNMANVRMLGQQASLMQSATPNPLAAPTPQHNLANQFYTSSVQGPPPGLKTAGTPPISGGGMFAQGHGFTTNTNLGLGANVAKQDANPELMRELLRGRSGTSGAGGVQSHEAAKREFMFPFLQSHPTPPPLTPANGLLSAFYGSQAGAYADHGPQKQKKKGKKHRHANTSSGGGGVVDLADPSILQARMHQVGAGAAGQALYGSQGQGGYNHSMMYGGGFNRW